MHHHSFTAGMVPNNQDMSGPYESMHYNQFMVENTRSQKSSLGIPLEVKEEYENSNQTTGWKSPQFF